MQTLAIGLYKMHSLGVAHRDIKAANILYAPKDGMMCKYIDYGLACMSPPEFMRVVMKIGSEGRLPNSITLPEMQQVISTCPEGAVGSPVYMAPETIRQEITEFSGLFPADVWSLGVLFYVIIFDQLPFTKGAADHMRLLYKIGGMVNGATVDEYPPENINPGAVRAFAPLIDAMWRPASTRVTAKEVAGMVTKLLIQVGKAPGKEQLRHAKDDLVMKIKVDPRTPYMIKPGKFSKTVQLLYPTGPTERSSPEQREIYARKRLGLPYEGQEIQELPPLAPRQGPAAPPPPRGQRQFFQSARWQPAPPITNPPPPTVPPSYNPRLRARRFFNS
jgi:serine/threonine protein kinase